ncbi:MAG: U32 family peptidase [Treponemataceae bacterium]|nr:U32 family peptidase [Treponemataceae bacterium]
MTNNVELLSPAGDEECFKAAILAGCNAIYFGPSEFNARNRAVNIDFEILPQLIKLAHSKNVRCYMTVNIIIFENEFSDVINMIFHAMQCGIDAVIVQDWGLLHVLKKIFPNLEIHASTQMTTHNLLQCQFLSECGVRQVNLSRELSFSQIRSLTDFLNSKDIVSEIFIHGAYCISFSGQCYFSGAIYGEEGNRGKCVQPCRRQWSCNNQDDLTPFNLKDNCASNYIDDLCSLGNVSLKIEGRIKGFDYVWAVTDAYRKKIDSCQDSSMLYNQLKGVMNRSYSDDYMAGKASVDMFTFGSRDHSYIENGYVKSYDARTCRISLSESAGNFDKIIIRGKKGEFILSGILVDGQNQNKNFRLKVTSKDFKNIYPAQKVFIQKDLIMQNQLEEKIKNLKLPSPKIDMEIYAHLNEKFRVKFILANQSCLLESDSPVQEAKNSGLTKEVLKEKLAAFGGSGFECGNLNFLKFDDNIFLPLKELKEMRRKALAYFESLEEKKPEEIKIPEFDFDSGLKSWPERKNIYLVSSVQEAKEKLKEKDLLALEFPVMSETFEELAEFVISNENVIPYFPAIIFDIHLEAFKKLAQRLNGGRTVIFENIGLAYYFAQKGFKVILGQHLNINNSFCLKFFREKLGPGFVGYLASKEAKVPFGLKGLTCFRLENSYDLMMQSRQCLLKKLSSCEKYDCNQDCLEKCEKRIEFSGKNGEKLVALKRKGFYSAIIKA